MGSNPSKRRVVAVGQTVRALDRYVRTGQRSSHADLPAAHREGELLLGRRGAEHLFPSNRVGCGWLTSSFE